jgi:hypothetical protein
MLIYYSYIVNILLRKLRAIGYFTDTTLILIKQALQLAYIYDVCQDLRKAPLF